TLLRLKQIKGREDWRLVVELPPELKNYVVPQGSIAVEGISLTVAQIEGERLEIAIIPHTYSATNLKSLHAGDPLNIEVDILAKYAEKTMRCRTATTLTAATLIERGF
ncbi:MAG TPA: riboflavin synthase, partial [Terriglobales bacterium]|nr:riboflavin synthase [Terriglobales bacterium]